jgi:hypothetical protein
MCVWLCPFRRGDAGRQALLPLDLVNQRWGKPLSGSHANTHGRSAVWTHDEQQAKVVKKKIAEVQGELGVAVATDVEPAKKWCVWLHALDVPTSRFSLLA